MVCRTIMDAIKQTVAANGFAECYVRPVIWLSDGGWNLNLDGGNPPWVLRYGNGTTILVRKRLNVECVRMSHRSPATIPMS